MNYFANKKARDVKIEHPTDKCARMNVLKSHRPSSIVAWDMKAQRPASIGEKVRAGVDILENQN